MKTFLFFCWTTFLAALFCSFQQSGNLLVLLQLKMWENILGIEIAFYWNILSIKPARSRAMFGKKVKNHLTMNLYFVQFPFLDVEKSKNRKILGEICRNTTFMFILSFPNFLFLKRRSSFLGSLDCTQKKVQNNVLSADALQRFKFENFSFYSNFPFSRSQFCTKTLR